MSLKKQINRRNDINNDIFQQGRQYILTDHEDLAMNEEEKDVDDEEGEEEEDPFSQIIYEQKYYEDREDDFLNGKVF